MVQKGQTFLFPGTTRNREVTIEAVGADSDVRGMFQENQVKLDKALNLEAGRRERPTVEELQESIDPQEIHSNRSPEARAADRGQDAPLTTDPLEWATDPSEHDFPGVDTGPTFRAEQGNEFDTDQFLNNL